MSAVEFELEGLEFVRATDDVGLLRVSGRWFAPASRVFDEIFLSVARGPETSPHRPLPDPEGVAPIASPAGGPWHGAFTMSTELAEDPRAEFFLRAGADIHVELPRPGEWRAAAEPAPAPALEDPVELADAPSDPNPEVGLLRTQLHDAGTELEVERRRREALAEELRAHKAVEDDLRKAIAMLEAELASAAQQASQKALAAERRHVASQSGPNGPSAGGRSHPADEEFLARLERARRASESVA